VSSQTLLEQILHQAQHFIIRRRCEYVLDTIAKERRDPLIITHWNSLNSPTRACVRVTILSHGYDTVSPSLIISVRVSYWSHFFYIFHLFRKKNSARVSNFYKNYPIPNGSRNALGILTVRHTDRLGAQLGRLISARLVWNPSYRRAWKIVALVVAKRWFFYVRKICFFKSTKWHGGGEFFADTSLGHWEAEGLRSNTGF